MARRETSHDLTWCKPNGEPVSCTEKIKVLNENYVELREMVKDALEDAVLMGCSQRQVRDAFHAMIEEIESEFPEKTDE